VRVEQQRNEETKSLTAKYTKYAKRGGNLSLVTSAATKLAKSSVCERFRRPCAALGGPKLYLQGRDGKPAGLPYRFWGQCRDAPASVLQAK